MGIIEEHMRLVMKDFYEFLQAKIHRNISISGFFNSFPGLVHFIYVDRTYNKMIAPCIYNTAGTCVC